MVSPLIVVSINPPKPTMGLDALSAGKGEYKSTQQVQPRPTEGDKSSCIMEYKEVAGVYFAKAGFYPCKVNFVKAF